MNRGAEKQKRNPDYSRREFIKAGALTVGAAAAISVSGYAIDAKRIEAAVDEGWLEIPPQVPGAMSLSPGLGAGESDSIRLALETREESLLIVDDRLARRYALKQGLNIAGTVRLLDLSEQRGLIESAEECIQEIATVGYRISVELLNLIRSE